MRRTSSVLDSNSSSSVVDVEVMEGRRDAIMSKSVSEPEEEGDWFLRFWRT